LGVLADKRISEATYRDGYWRNVLTQDYDMFGVWLAPTPEQEGGGSTKSVAHDIILNRLHRWSSRHGGHWCAADLVGEDVDGIPGLEGFYCPETGIEPVNRLFFVSTRRGESARQL
jgi:hypothetical protein